MKKMMRVLCTLLFAALPALAAAQVEKRVEVTKEYMPDVPPATKLAVRPDMNDTVRLRPEIDYAITPLAISVPLSVEPIRPVSVTYWEFNRPKPFYLKLGAGYPFRSTADFYASTQNPGTGYLLGYINHEGEYGPLRNAFGIRGRATRTGNRIGVAAGKYLGRHTLEGEFSYDNLYGRRYGQFTAPTMPAGFGSDIRYGSFDVAIRLGDDFKDLSRVNFALGLRGSLFLDRSDAMYRAYDARQTHLGVDGALARSFGAHTLRLKLLYEHGDGTKAAEGFFEDLFSVGVRYGVRGGRLRLELGADYYYDKIAAQRVRHYVVPALELRLDLGSDAFVPYLELDGALRDNAPRTLARLNPYGSGGVWGAKSTVSYDFRLGASGTSANGRFVYRFYASAGIRENQLFWYVPFGNAVGGVPLFAGFAFAQGRLQTGSLNGEMEYRPVSRLRMTLGLHGYLYDDTVPYAHGLPPFEGRFALRYGGRKYSVGVSVDLLGRRSWTVTGAATTWGSDTFDAPFSADVGVYADWRVTQGFSLFVEGSNLACMKLYRQAFYPEYGAGFVAGVKFVF